MPGSRPSRLKALKCRMRPLPKTIAAMRRGVPVFVQAALADGGWLGGADILRRREKPSAIGARSYEPIDTKLARETRAGSAPLCICADLLTTMQGCAPVGIQNGSFRSRKRSSPTPHRTEERDEIAALQHAPAKVQCWICSRPMTSRAAITTNAESSKTAARFSTMRHR